MPISWIDRFFDWVERLPIPYWLFYVIVYLAVGLVQHALLWLDGTLPTGTWLPAAWSQDVWFVFIPSAWHYLRRAGSHALQRFRPALQVSDKEFDALRQRFTRLSARSGRLLLLAALLLTPLVGPAALTYAGDWAISPYNRFFTVPFVIAVFPLLLGFFFMVVRSLVWIGKFYRLVTQINLFNLTTLYAFSSLTMRIGTIFVIFLLLNILGASLYPGTQNQVTTLFYSFLHGSLAIMVFLLPLLGIHARLVAAKEEATARNNHLINKGFAELQRKVERGSIEQINRLRTANSALLEYRQELNKISTWPWDAATLRTFITALLVPMTTWAVQQLLLSTFAR
ncbi:MAG: hypothetical protein KIS88_02490 [Anaerolineales bacterium]|nr:hypothetical protein [Anaerolineales bacterium]